MEFLKVIASRLIAAGVSSLAGYASVKYGMNVDQDTQAQLATGIVGVVIPAMTAVYAVTHKVLDKHLNPGDAASSHIAVQEAAEHAVLVAKDVH